MQQASHGIVSVCIDATDPDSPLRPPYLVPLVSPERIVSCNILIAACICSRRSASGPSAGRSYLECRVPHRASETGETETSPNVPDPTGVGHIGQGFDRERLCK